MNMIIIEFVRRYIRRYIDCSTTVIISVIYVSVDFIENYFKGQSNHCLKTLGRIFFFSRWFLQDSIGSSVLYYFFLFLLFNGTLRIFFSSIHLFCFLLFIRIDSCTTHLNFLINLSYCAWKLGHYYNAAIKPAHFSRDKINVIFIINK